EGVGERERGQSDESQDKPWRNKEVESAGRVARPTAARRASGAHRIRRQCRILSRPESHDEPFLWVGRRHHGSAGWSGRRAGVRTPAPRLGQGSQPPTQKPGTRRAWLAYLLLALL